jgi:phage terminase large subunit-like protein
MMPAPSDDDLAELWASATMLAEQRVAELPDWADLSQLDSDDEIWAGIQRTAIRELEPPLPRPWRATARAKQLPPAGRWRHWILSCGRGFGKTHVGSNVLAELAVSEPGDYAVVAPTLGDAKKICVEGPSGLLKALGDDLKDYNKSDYILYLHNGSRIVLGSADAPDRIRGWNLRAVWCDEVGSWRDPKVWNEGIKFATRIGDPRIIITTTPTRGNKILVKLFDDYLGKGGDILGGFAGNTVLTRGGTYENRANLSEDWLREIEEEFAGTALGRQELEGELLRIVPGALVSMDTISLTRVTVEQCPDFWNVVTALDPSVTNTEDSDECGIISAGVGPAPLDWIPPKGVPPSLASAPHIYIVEDSSLRAGPESWARQGLNTAAEWMADCMVAEVNNGGDLVFTNVLQVARSEGHTVPNLRPVHASVGKRTRAQPMGGMWNQHRVHLVGAGFKTLADQWCTFVDGTGQKSPDRFDASVWAGTGLVPSLGVKSGTEVRVLGAA